jgi:hypothetical protein
VALRIAGLSVRGSRDFEAERDINIYVKLRIDWSQALKRDYLFDVLWSNSRATGKTVAKPRDRLEHWFARHDHTSS